MRDGLGSAAAVCRAGTRVAVARRPSRPSGALKRAREASASSALSIACSPARTSGTTSWKAPKSGWAGFLSILRLYLTHFRGQRSAIMQVMAPVAGTEAEAWETLTAALGVKGVSVGQRWTTPAGVSPLGGVVEYVTENPYDALLRLDQPGPGIAALGADHLSRWPGHGGDELVPVRRSGGRDRRPRDTAVAGVVSGTLPDADGAEQERMIDVLGRLLPAGRPACPAHRVAGHPAGVGPAAHGEGDVLALEHGPP